jgi:hypothetical protein
MPRRAANLVASVGWGFATLAAWGCVVAGGGEKGASPAKAKEPVPLHLLPEMERNPDIDGGRRCRPDQFPKEKAAALADWQKKKRDWVAKQVTPEVVRKLSRWARKEMEQYKAVPPLTKVDFKPVRHREADRRLLLEGTLDTLPTHSPLVTRWLKVFLLYDKTTKSIIRVTVTIRGQLLE